ncbi:MAG: hypothetical protein U0791_07590 [Gemmataceae bacterium]
MMLCVAAAGCAHDPFAFLQRKSEPPIRIAASRPVGGFGNAFGNVLDLESAPGLHAESVLFERPLGDPLLNRDIWTRDAAAIPAQTRVLLEENGLRVAVIGGNLPPEFLRMLESGEGAVSPQAHTFGSREETVVPTVGPVESCQFCVRADLVGEPETKKLTAVHGGFSIRPQLADDGRVKVRVEPQVQHGERQDYIRPASDATGFTLQSEVPHERYASLGFDVSLDPGDYLVIGWPATDEGDSRSLGSTLFCVDAKGEPRQRVLVIRAGFRSEPAAKPAAYRSIASHVGR